MWQKINNTSVGSDVAERIDLATRANESATFTFTFFDPTTGTPLDLTGYTFEFSIDNTSTNVLSATAGTGLTIATPASGVIVANLDTVQMGFPAGTYTYRLTATNTTPATTKTWLQGLLSHVSQTQLQPASNILENKGQTYVRIGNKDILSTITNN